MKQEYTLATIGPQVETLTVRADAVDVKLDQLTARVDAIDSKLEALIIVVQTISSDIEALTKMFVDTFTRFEERLSILEAEVRLTNQHIDRVMMPMLDSHSGRIKNLELKVL